MLNGGRGGALAGIVLLGLLPACSTKATGHYDRQQLANRLAQASTPAQPDDAPTPPGLLVGDFRLASPSVVDGDTIKVVGIDGTLRLLGIDTEETFKSDKDRRAYDEGFDVYLAKKQEGHSRPIKAATPLGMDAKHWAEDFFEGAKTVRLERDHPKELRGRYGRLLTYVLVEKDGEWLNYNVECVRAGMSPYFSKYGYSRRFHDQFVEAQAQAREAGIGIWDPELEHYPDYDQRLKWWNARADVIAAFEREAEGKANFISLTNWDSMDRLEALEGHEVVLLATVGDIKPREGKRPAKAMLSRRMFSDLPMIFFDDDVFADSAVEEARGEFVRVTGTVSRYEFRSRRRGKKNEQPRSQLQIRIRKPQQIAFVDTRPSRFADGSGPPPKRVEPAEPARPARTTEPADEPTTVQQAENVETAAPGDTTPEPATTTPAEATETSPETADAAAASDAPSDRPSAPLLRP